MALSILNELVHTYENNAKQDDVSIETVDKASTALQIKHLSNTMRNKMKDAIKSACDDYSFTTPNCQLIISDHLLFLIISFTRGKLPINQIKKPLKLVEAYGEINRRKQLEGYCFLRYTDGKTYEGHICNGEIKGTWEYLAQSWAISIGFTNLDLQENGSFALVLDDKYEINFGLLSKTNEILCVGYLKTKIAEMKNETRLQLYETLLQANFAFKDTASNGYSGALGVCPTAQNITFSVTQSFEGTDVKTMSKLFDYVVQASEKWQKKINEITQK
eukprot:207125_1